LPDG
jgi:excisionase family DNA binding protein